MDPITETIAASSAYQEVFKAQKRNQFLVKNTTYKQRKAKLKRLLKGIFEHQASLEEAMYADFRKNKTEVDMAELFVVISEIRHTIRHLKDWMRPQPVDNTAVYLGTKSTIYNEAKGVVLIISPWNFPINLTLGPLVSAIAAGNCAIIKPSEFTPHTTKAVKHLLEDVFDTNEVAVFEGDHTASQKLLKLPFNHIFFTGSPAVGKIIMKAAATNLASVTLELGGKSPVIVDETANIDVAAKRLAWGKSFNAGQICVSPDYLLIHDSKKEEFVTRFRHHLEKYFGSSKEEVKVSESYPRIVNQKHFVRIKKLVEDAVLKGAKVEVGGDYDESQNYISPTLLSGVNDDMAIMQEEIFGPVFPIRTYNTLDEAVEYINEKEIPLAMYIFSSSKKNIRYLQSHTSAGSGCINDCVVQFNHGNLPFGGHNFSGIGKSHGKYGFEAFSNQRSIVKQPIFFSIPQLFYPPYTPFKQKLMDLAMKWL